MVAETLSQNPAAASTRNGVITDGQATGVTDAAANDAAESAARPLRWNRGDYARLTELGFFEDRRVELIEGEIIEMAAMNGPHAASISAATYALTRAFSADFHVRVQCPLDLQTLTQPEPDLAVVRGAPADYKEHHPTTAELVVEISDSTLLRDQTVKAGLYARAAIAEYWIVNLNENQLEVHRRPAPRAAADFGHDYLERTFYRRDDTVSPLCAPQLSIRVADLLP